MPEDMTDRLQNVLNNISRAEMKVVVFSTNRRMNRFYFICWQTIKEHE